MQLTARPLSSRWAGKGCGQLARTASKVPRWACNGCGKLIRRAFECQDGLVKGAANLPAGPVGAKTGL